MARILKWLGIAAASVIALLIVAATAVTLLFDPNDYRDDIAAAVEKQTGRTLTIEGDIELSLFPWLGVEVGRVTLADREGFHDEPFLEIDGMEAAVRLLPLLWGQLETRAVQIEAPVARLMVNEAGESNWEDLIERIDEPLDEPPPPDDQPAPAELPDFLADAVFGGLQVRRGQLFWTNLAEDDHKEVERFDIDIGALRLDQPVPIQAEWQGTGTDLPRLSGQVQLEATMARGLDRVGIEGLEVTVQAQGPEVPGYQQQLLLTGNGQVGLGDELTVEWPHLAVGLAGARLETAIDLVLDAEGADGRIDWSLPPFNLRTTLSRLDAGLPALEDTEAMTRFTADGRIKLEGQRLAIRETQMRMDESQFDIEGAIDDWTGPSITLSAQLDRINVDRYMPAGERRAADEPGAPDTGLPDFEEIALELPMEPLRTLELDGDLAIGETVISGLRLDDISAELTGGNGRVGLEEIRAALYEGQYHGSTLLDARGDFPYFETDHRLEGVRFGPLLEDLMERDWIHGRGDFVLSGAGGGPNLAALIEDFRGDAEIVVEDGSFLGLNIPFMFREAVARIQAQPRPEPPDEEARTDFASASALIEFQDGIARNDNLRLDSPLLRGRGEGRINILEETIDYRLRLSLIDNLEDADGRPIRGLTDVTVPLEFTGDLLSPRIRFDLRAAMSDEQIRQLRQARERLEEAEQKIREGFQERVREELEEQTDRAEERVRREAESILRRLR